MKMRGKGTRVRVVAAGAAATGALLIAVGVGSASAGDPGDAFYLAKSKNTFVSFMIGASSETVSKLGYTARKLPCDKGKKLSGMASSGLNTAPIQTNLSGDPYFEALYLPLDPGRGGISGKIDKTSVKGTLSLQATRKVDHKTVWCRSGNRKWTATQVPEDTWLAARKKQGYLEQLRARHGYQVESDN